MRSYHILAGFIAAALSLSAAAFGNSINASYLELKQWPNGKKPTVVVARPTDTACYSGLQVSTSPRARVIWTDNNKRHPEMEKLALTMFERSGFDIVATTGWGGMLDYLVGEVALGSAEDVRKELRLGTTTFELHQGDVDQLPPGATKAMLLYTKNILRNISIPVLAVAYDPISDEDLRRIAFEEGVARNFCWRPEVEKGAQ